MSLGLCFYIILLILLLFNLWSGRGPDKNWNYPAIGGNLILWLLLLLLGWSEFGPPLHK